MMDDVLNQPKHDTFRIKVSNEEKLPANLVIDTVNGKPVDAIPLTVKDAKMADGEATGVAEVGAKTLAKHFAKGINRFDVSYKDGGERHSAEVVMDVKM